MKWNWQLQIQTKEQDPTQQNLVTTQPFILEAGVKLRRFGYSWFMHDAENGMWALLLNLAWITLNIEKLFRGLANKVHEHRREDRPGMSLTVGKSDFARPSTTGLIDRFRQNFTSSQYSLDRRASKYLTTWRMCKLGQGPLVKSFLNQALDVCSFTSNFFITEIVGIIHQSSWPIQSDALRKVKIGKLSDNLWFCVADLLPLVQHRQIRGTPWFLPMERRTPRMHLHLGFF